MAYLLQLFSLTLPNVRQTLISHNSNDLVNICIRYASKKASTSTKNSPRNTKPKHRGWKVQDGHYVQAGKMLATQLTTRFHPGLNVGFARNGTLFAMEAGRVMVTCEKIDPNLKHTWIQRNYPGRENHIIYKKHFHVIPEPQHNRFKLIDRV